MDHFPNFRGENEKHLKPPTIYIKRFLVQDTFSCASCSFRSVSVEVKLRRKASQEVLCNIVARVAPAPYLPSYLRQGWAFVETPGNVLKVINSSKFMASKITIIKFIAKFKSGKFGMFLFNTGIHGVCICCRYSVWPHQLAMLYPPSNRLEPQRRSPESLFRRDDLLLEEKQ